MEQNIIPFFVNSPLKVVATETESNTASTAIPLSLFCSTKGIPNRFIYTASKAAVLGITKSVAADYINQGIRCNAICPGTIQSPSLEQRLQDMGDYENARKQFVARQSMGRFGEAEEVAHLASFLASDKAAYITGEVININGGIYA